MPEHNQQDALDGIWGLLELIDGKLERISEQLDAHYDVM